MVYIMFVRYVFRKYMYIVYLNGQNFNIQIRNSCHCMIALDKEIKETKRDVQN